MAKLYIASPLGFSETGTLFLYGKIVPIIEKIGCEPLIPWELTDKQGIMKFKAMPAGKRKQKVNKYALDYCCRNSLGGKSKCH